MRKTFIRQKENAKGNSSLKPSENKTRQANKTTKHQDILPRQGNTKTITTNRGFETMTEIEDKLQLALSNIEHVKTIILNMKEKAEEEDDEYKTSMLTNYNLELLDLKLRLKDMLRNLPKIE